MCVIVRKKKNANDKKYEKFTNIQKNFLIIVTISLITILNEEHNENT